MTIAWAVARPDGSLVAGQDAERVVPAASTVKVAIAIAFWQAVGDGRVDPSVRIADPAPTGDGALLDHLPGIAPTLAHCATLMLAVSCNTSTNVVIDAIGLDACDDEARRLGLARTRIRRRMHDAVARREGRENETCAADLASLLAALADPGRVPEAAAVHVRRALAASEHVEVLGEALADRVERVLPKRGSLPDAEHDCALVEVGGAALGVAVVSAPAAPLDELRAAARALPLGVSEVS